MIRGTEFGEMRMIRLRTSGSRIFSEAYFVLRRAGTDAPIDDIVAEAQRVIRKYSSASELRLVRRRFPVRAFLIGVFSGVAAASFAAAVIALCLCR